MTDRRTIRRALVTGASGFVGSALCAELVRREIEVVGTGRTTAGGGLCKWVRLELPGPVPPTALEGVDTVFHLAGRAHAVADSRREAPLYDLVNRQGTRDVARAAAAAGVERFVLMSSVKAMRKPGDEIVRESDSSMPIDPYGLSKRLAEKEAFDAGSDKMGIVVLRPALVYGLGVKGNLGSLLCSLRKGRNIPLPRTNNRRSLVGVVDVVRCAIVAAELGAAVGHTYVLTDRQVYSTERIICALARSIGSDATPRVRVPLALLQVAAWAGDGIELFTGHRSPIDTQRLRRLVGNAEYESHRVHEELGFLPVHTLEDFASGPGFVAAPELG